MKVKCIHDGRMWVKHVKRKSFLGFRYGPKKIYSKGPMSGEIVTVKKEVWSEGNLFYVLIEWPGQWMYHSCEFLPIEQKFEKVTASKIKESASVN